LCPVAFLEETKSFPARVLPRFLVPFPFCVVEPRPKARDELELQTPPCLPFFLRQTPTHTSD
jgi:hypothetical protein